ncbi:MAG TPA: alpha-2-macroglobulin family protein, partial [bacterium]|nr:alpha-2-macroglobulin family protein [bacterium]
YYAPPNNDGFLFGDRRWRYGWGLYGTGEFDESPRGRGWNWRRAAPVKPAAEGSGHLDAHGELHVTAPLEHEKPDDVGPGSFTLEAQVFDKNRQSIAGRTSFVVHPAEVYVGVRMTRAIVKEKEHVPFEAIAAAIDGTRVETDVTATLLEQAWKQTAEKGADGSWSTKWTMKETDVAHCTLRTAKDVKSCDMVAPRAGQYVLRLTAKDKEGRSAITATDVWVYGDEQVSWRLNDPSRIELVADKSEYVEGDNARVLVKSPFPHAEGILALEANGILETRRVHLDGSAQMIEVPITAKHLPNVWVSLALSRGRLKPEEMPEGGKDAEDLGRPAFATGEASLKVSLAPKTISVAAASSKKEAGPGESVDLAVTLTDAAGKPVAADAAVFLVDEGVLALLGYQTPDPMPTFWAQNSTGSAIKDLRELLLKQEKGLKLADARNKNGAPGDAIDTTVTLAGAIRGEGRGGGGMAQAEAKPMPRKSMMRMADDASGGADKDEEKAPSQEPGAPPITARTNFASTAFWAANVTTGADGHAKVTVKLPDNLTTFRVMVVAQDTVDRFGHGDTQVTVRKRLLVRPSLPRFLQYGDTFEASMVVHNQTGKDGQVEVIARGANIGFDEDAKKTVFVKNGDSAEVRWKAHAQNAGEARVQFGAAFDGSTDAAELSLPVKLPATSEAFATYGTTEGSVAQPVLLPADAIPEFGALDVQTSSTALTTLSDAVDYLYSYPYECLEQTASRILPIVALKDVIRDFHLGDKKTNAEADALAKDGIARIASLQGWDGGFKLWPESNRADPWSSGYATFVLLRAKENHFDVPQTTLDRAKQYLLREGLNPPKIWGEEYRRAVQVQSLLVLTDMGEKPTTVAEELFAARDKLPFFSRAQLLVSLSRMYGAKDARVKTLLDGIDNAAVESPSTAHYAEQRTESLKLLMHSEARTDAMVLWAMVEVRPDDPLIPKVVKGLNDSRVKGRWLTTQENAWVILAMSRYYHAFEKTTPDFVARTWLADRFMGEAGFKGRTMDIKRITVPLESLYASDAKAIAARTPETLVLAKDGPGRMYYRLGLTYAPKSLDVKPEEQGFSVTRGYEAVDDKGDVARDADGTWVIKAGATVKVRLTIVVPDRAYYAAITDPLPAGLEAVNTELATSARARPSGEEESVRDTWSWYSFWAFDHIQMRDDRVELFANQLPTGVYEYTYLARATTLGKFVVPPLKAEEM